MGLELTLGLEPLSHHGDDGTSPDTRKKAEQPNASRKQDQVMIERISVLEQFKSFEVELQIQVELQDYLASCCVSEQWIKKVTFAFFCNLSAKERYCFRVYSLALPKVASRAFKETKTVIVNMNPKVGLDRAYLPPFSPGKLPLEQSTEFWLGDEGLGFSLPNEEREFLAVEGIEGYEVGFFERYEAGLVGRQRRFPRREVGAAEIHGGIGNGNAGLGKCNLNLLNCFLASLAEIH
ncbi:hypothetical protein M5K25_004521 [Dendrobium thyrsiflorum]|uniref:Uncharacterized protein n=1 Tax=Dendrobium thyrsiflorum TaxID=117978 RepID=A0ABD0VTU2_DENTH